MIAILIIILILLFMIMLNYMNNYVYENFTTTCKNKCEAPKSQSSDCKPLTYDDPTWVKSYDNSTKKDFWQNTTMNLISYQEPPQLVDNTQMVCPWKCANTSPNVPSDTCIYNTDCSTCEPKTIFKNVDSKCPNSQYGCCGDGITTKIDFAGSNCLTTASQSCVFSEFGCCPDGEIKRIDLNGTNCPVPVIPTGTNTPSTILGYTGATGATSTTNTGATESTYTSYTNSDATGATASTNTASTNTGATGAQTSIFDSADYNHYFSSNITGFFNTGNEDKYILKTSLVPTICPTCPNINYPDATPFDEKNKIEQSKDNKTIDSSNNDTSTLLVTGESNFCSSKIINDNPTSNTNSNNRTNYDFIKNYPNIPYPILPDFTTFGI
jgi:hypothetical protein